MTPIRAIGAAAVVVALDVAVVVISGGGGSHAAGGETQRLGDTTSNDSVVGALGKHRI
jgi:hypothetical protein